MKRLKDMILHLIKGMSKAGARFPLTVACLSGAAAILCYVIYTDEQPAAFIEKLALTFIVGAVLGMAAQFACERFEKLFDRRAIAYAVSVVLTGGYFMILWPAPEISMETGVRTFVAVFAMLCAVLWLPSFKGKADFNKVALVHFKSACISVLYSGVLSGGIAAIIVAVDILLFNVNDDSYAYMMTIVWVLFATIYYLSLLPRFSSEEESDREQTDQAANYPKFLEILVSYIAIPLISAYTIVLFAYFGKILATQQWPSGQLGGMVLAYSAAGLVVFVLSSLLGNKFAYWYRMIFPKVLIPVVIMQLISVWIRLNAYGITESRYYVALFGVFSIACGILLSIRPISRNSMIALLAAGFAIVSVIPPADAFTMSRNSQISRLESILEQEGILSQEGTLTPDPSASEKAKSETTNILQYLDSHSSLRYISWLPEEFNMYEDMKLLLGFEPTYIYEGMPEEKYFYANIDGRDPIDISGYDIYTNVFMDRWNKDGVPDDYDLTVGGVQYMLSVSRISAQEVVVEIKDQQGNTLVGTGLYDFAAALIEFSTESKDALPAESMTLETEKNGYKLKIIFQNISMTMGDSENAGADYGFFAFFATPD